jgi:hypothetical protein
LKGGETKNVKYNPIEKKKIFRSKTEVDKEKRGSIIDGLFFRKKKTKETPSNDESTETADFSNENSENSGNELKKEEDSPEYTKSSSYLEKIKNMSEGLVKRIQTGIKSSLSRINTKSDMFSGEKFISKNDFDDNFPQMFHGIRKLSNISEKEYSNSICQGEMKIIITPGKSGALLFFTKDGSFIIKTVTKSEYVFLQKNITEYAKFLNNNPNTLLVKFIGLYSCKFNKKTIQFIVMNNLFGQVKMDLTFDLKGSKEGRYAKNGERVLKDLDILERKTKLNFEMSKQLLFLKQISLDTQFLAKMKVMDYSLLLGVYKNPNPKKELSLPKFIGMSTFQCVPSKDNTEVYFIGIIDFLQVWNLKKKAELQYKSLTVEKINLSAIPPKDYSIRFNDFMSKLVL